MNLLSILLPLLLIVLIIILSVSQAYRRKQCELKKQNSGLNWLLKLKTVLSEIQQHRGLTTGFLNGSSELIDQIESLQSRANRHIEELTTDDPWFEKNDRWLSITEHWRRLTLNFRSNVVDNNLTQHHMLIQNLLYFIDDMAEEHDLHDVTTIDNVPLHFVWKELLIASECIGQARALGTAIVAAQSCDATAKIRLQYLYQKIEKTTDTAWKNIPPSPKQSEMLKELLECIDQHLLKPKPTVSVADYFSVATDALDGLHTQYDEIIQQTMSS